MAIELILGNSSRRFSGMTSTLLQVLPHQRRLLSLAVLGGHHLPVGVPVLSFPQALRIARRGLPDGRHLIFHARRNDEMIQALLLKQFAQNRMKIVFTSAAQRWHSRFTRRLIRQMDGVIASCQASAVYLQSPPACIIPHGVDTQIYRPPACRRQAWRALGLPGKYGIGLFGRVRPQKGVDVLLDAIIPLLAHYPDFTVVIVGEITPAQQYFATRQQAKVTRAGLNDRMFFLNRQPWSRMPALFQAMSLVTALSRSEGFGLTVLEGMSSGAAVLASRTGAWPEIIEPGVGGGLVPCGDVVATRTALESLMQTPEKLEEMGRQGRTKVECLYTVKQEAQALCRYFKSLM